MGWVSGACFDMCLESMKVLCSLYFYFDITEVTRFALVNFSIFSD